MIKKIKWWFEVRKDLKLLKKLDKKLNGSIYHCYDTDDIEFHGEQYWCEWHFQRLAIIYKNREEISKIYSTAVYDKKLKAVQETFTRSHIRCQELEDKILALKFKIYGNI